MTKDVEEIARGLTEAQRDIVCRTPQMIHQPAFMFAPPQWGTAGHVAAFARQHPTLFQKQRGRFSLEYRLSPLGLEVRRILQERNHD